MRVKPKNYIAIVFNIFLVVGLILGIASGMIYYHHFKLIRNSDSVIAEIVELKGAYSDGGDQIRRAYVTYTVDGKEYEAPINYYSSSMRLGDKIKVYYQTDNPQKIITKINVLGLAFAIIGIVFFLLGFVSDMVMVIRNLGKKKLLLNGQRIYANVSSVEKVPYYRINNRHPYRIICSYTDQDNTLHIFKSELIWFDPTELLRDNVIPVIVNPSNYHKYVVVIEEALKQKVVFH